MTPLEGVKTQEVGRRLEDKVERILRSKGFEMFRIKTDGDILARKDGKLYVVEVKKAHKHRRSIRVGFSKRCLTHMAEFCRFLNATPVLIAELNGEIRVVMNWVDVTKYTKKEWLDSHKWHGGRICIINSLWERGVDINDFSL